MINVLEKKIWGITYEEEMCDGLLMWRAYIKNPFYHNNGWVVGINEKFLKEAIHQGVDILRIVVGQRDISMAIPPIKELKRKDKAGEFEMKESMFENSPAMKIYYFKI